MSSDPSSCRLENFCQVAKSTLLCGPSSCNSPPVVFLVSRTLNRTACLKNICLEFSAPVEMVVTIEGLRAFVVSINRPLHDPWHHHVLLVAFVPASTTVLLLKSPHIYQGSPTHAHADVGRVASFFGARSQRLQDRSNSSYTPGRGGQMVDHCDRDGKIKRGVRMWQRKIVGNDCNLRAMLRGDLDQFR